MRINFWYLSSLLISFIVAIPILTVFTSFFQETTNYFEILKNTYLFEYILNSFVLLKLSNFTGFLNNWSDPT